MSDDRNRLTDLHNHAGGTTISRHTYTHHPDGNRATLTDQDDRVTTYTYDVINRLQEEKQVDGSGATRYDHQFVYDDVGNLLQKLDLTASPPNVLTELAYNAADQITSTGFGYDDRGNMLTEHRPEVEEDWTYEYGGQNRMTHAYDGDGHRVEQAVSLKLVCLCGGSLRCGRSRSAQRRWGVGSEVDLGPVGNYALGGSSRLNRCCCWSHR